MKVKLKLFTFGQNLIIKALFHTSMVMLILKLFPVINIWVYGSINFLILMLQLVIWLHLHLEHWELLSANLKQLEAHILIHTPNFLTHLFPLYWSMVVVFGALMNFHQLTLCFTGLADFSLALVNMPQTMQH